MMNSWGQQQYINKIENLKEAYRQDTYGTATPEGTLKLFIEAFEKGDADLASKYFVIEKQEEYRDKIESWIKLGKKDEMDVWENNEIVTSIFFSKNTYNNLWKIEQL